jgi:hypothetical protein
VFALDQNDRLDLRRSDGGADWKLDNRCTPANLHHVVSLLCLHVRLSPFYDMTTQIISLWKQLSGKETRSYKYSFPASLIRLLILIYSLIHSLPASSTGNRHSFGSSRNHGQLQNGRSRSCRLAIHRNGPCWASHCWFSCVRCDLSYRRWYKRSTQQRPRSSNLCYFRC